MSACPPGLVFNPQTLRCVKVGGRIGKRLAPIVSEEAGWTTRKNNFMSRAGSYVPKLLRNFTRSVTTQSRLPELLTQRSQPTRSIPVTYENRCPVGKILNPATGKCVKVGGRVQRKIQRVPTAGEGEGRGPPILYTRKASKIPEGGREAMRNWISTQCANSEEPFTGKNLRAMTEGEMSSIIRTSAGTCLRAEYLDQHIRHEREKGKDVVDPLNPRRQLTLSNMDILGRVARRILPDYRIPQVTRKAPASVPSVRIAERPQTRVQQTMSPVYPSYHNPTVRIQEDEQLRPRTRIPSPKSVTLSVPKQTGQGPYPANWKFFIGKDARSGNDFYSVYYYDKDMAEVTNEGIQVPPEARQIDIGVIPAFVGVSESGNPSCTTSALVEKLISLSKKNRLIHKLGNQYVGTVELPSERARWKTPDGAIQRRFFQQVCAYLDELLQ